ncbi:S-adenosyl-L-methionine-dependent methyltransferase [Rickenella mellea]|uniref:S-adenosyl-L-methionine-dependent methyltransferase n=1 Tax=Rickenella mellea TaxID=50990 RepID=A0A4Y7QID4_9AGAM|nr:S-adenosyl-L-methionine-dependent methyltransferase [Rickenella mellea]
MPSDTSKAVIPIQVIDEPQAHEKRHVHEVYDQIASHFSSTRYKPWPVVANFLQSIPTGWVGLDSGTGNGKYLPLPANRSGETWTIGLDRSQNLLRIAMNANYGDTNCIREVVLGDAIETCWRVSAFDYAISIATIHHFSTKERRERAVQSLLQTLSPSHGRALIYVWAIEQDALSKRSIPISEQSSPGHGEDVFVPWVLSKQQDKSASDSAPERRVHHRYYHMFEKGELRDLICGAAHGMGLTVGSPREGLGPVADGMRQKIRGLEIVEDSWERSNYYIELRLWEVEAPDS